MRKVTNLSQAMRPLLLLLNVLVFLHSPSTDASRDAAAEELKFGEIFQFEQELRDAQFKSKLKSMKEEAASLRLEAKASPVFQVCLKKNALLIDLDTEKVFYVPSETYVYLYSKADQRGEAYYFVHDPQKVYDARFKVSAYDFETLNSILDLAPGPHSFKEFRSPIKEQEEFLSLRHTFYGAFIQSKRDGVAGKKDFYGNSLQFEYAFTIHNQNALDFGMLFSYVKDFWVPKDRAYVKQAYYLGPLLETEFGNFLDNHFYFQLLGQYALKTSLIQQNEASSTLKTWDSKSYRLQARLRIMPKESYSAFSFGAGLGMEWYQLHRRNRDENTRELSVLGFMAYQWEKFL